MTKRWILVVVTALALAGTAAAEVLLNSSHTGAVRDIRVTNDGSLLLTAGDDGKLKVWDRESRGIRASWQLSTLPIVRLALHPTEPRVATVEYDGASRIFLSVWNWEDGEPVFRRALDELPLVLRFSPQGSYIVTSKPTFDSISLLEADTGRERSFLDEGFGIVTYAVVSRSESNIMTYTGANGRIRYFDLSSGRLVQSAETVAGLEYLTLLENRRYAVGAGRGGLVIVDIIDGDVEDTYALTGVTGIDREADSGQLVVRRTLDDGSQLVRFTTDGTSLRRQFSPRASTGTEDTSFVAHDNLMYYATVDGTIYYFRAGGRLRNVFARDRLEPVSDIAAGFQSLIVATPDRLVRFSSDIFTRPMEAPRYLRYRVTPNPAAAPLLIESAGSRDILMWQRDDAAPTIWTYDPILNRAEVFLEEETPVRHIAVHDGGMIVLTADGSFRDLADGSQETTFSYTALGMEHVVRTEELGVLVGKSRTDAFSSALLRINPETGETVPIRTDERLIFDMAYDGESNLYTLGLRNDGATTETILQRRFGRNLVAADTLLTTPGEHLGGHVVYHDESESAFAVINQPAPFRIHDRTPRSLEAAEHRARRLEAVGNVLAAANHDGSISFWEIEAGTHLADLYMLRGGEWALVTADGRFATPSQFDQSYLRYVPTSPRDRRSLEDRRIELPLR